MINISELRIGNLYQWSELASMGRGTGIIMSGKDIDMYSEFKNPIPITRQWLLDLGFEEIHFHDISMPSIQHSLFGDTRISFCGVSGMPNKLAVLEYSDKFYKGNCIAVVEFVHQLQNLIYFLTGKELEYKPM